ncbi:MAG: DUF3459 domain-containing protein [Deltaproteobacteria bacterium]|nr:MAG: DUF3459 domain-containing protein [Deltaproteobacteria bacterium]
MEWLWWRDGVLYQIYPRSFMDASGDGVGDLEGIRRRLDHLAWLGVDGIWISPCFPSPMADFGYDVADYRDIDPLFGSLEDFDRLVRDAHAHGIRVVLDLVPNHSSDRHPWFLESRADPASPKRDWYVWRDPKPGGAPPNNWISIFGGPAWEWDEPTGQYFLHSFLKEQPDLNWRNPELVREMHGVLRFWFERGVDGFRIDVIQRIAKDPALRDNPEIADSPGGYGGQRHVHDENHPDVHGMLRGLRAVADEYPERMLVGEVYLRDPAEVAKYYGQGDQLHLAFNFALLFTPWDAQRFGAEIQAWDSLVPAEGWPVHVLSNHDAPRHASRWDDPEHGEARARLAAMLLLTLRGTPFLYYGEEIGMRNVEIPRERLQDPLAHTLHPSVARDPERTPMQWDASAGSGFTRAPPWLPLARDAALRNVERQRAERSSLLWLYRDLIALRRRTPALQRGSFRRLESPDGVLAYERRAGASVARIALNFTPEAQRVELGAEPLAGGLRSAYGTPLPAAPEPVELAPSEGIVLVVAASR